MVQRRGTDNSSDYLLWARDNENNAMGNMGATTIWPFQLPDSPASNNVAVMDMSAARLLLLTWGDNSRLVQGKLTWVAPNTDPTDPNVWNNVDLPQAMFQTDWGAPNNLNQEGCAVAGIASDGAVRYFKCNFSC